MRVLRVIVSSLLGVGIWLALKYGLHIPDRYLPGVDGLIRAGTDIGADWWLHIWATLSRTAVGFSLGVFLGIGLSLILFRLRLLAWAMPLVHATRAVPAVAMIPFFLLWFGFSEVGRYALVFLGIGLNVLVACADVLENPREMDQVLFRNFDAPINTRIISYWLPRVLENLLPTLRFGVSLALGVIVVAELLGAQRGLGYLMQTSGATASLNVLFLSAAILGVLATILDLILRTLWKYLIDWRR